MCMDIPSHLLKTKYKKLIAILGVVFLLIALAVLGEFSWSENNIIRLGIYPTVFLLELGLIFIILQVIK